MAGDTSTVEKHLKEIIELNQKLNDQSFKEIIRRLEPLDKWPTRMDELAGEIRELQKTKAVLEGKANQTDVAAALGNAKNANIRANISIAITIALFLFTIWDKIK